MTPTAQRIKARWRQAGGDFQNNTLSGAELGRPSPGLPVYSGSSITNTTNDFLGDWRAADSWMRFDMYRVRNRSRQLARGNKWVTGYLRTMRQNVLGSKGFAFQSYVTTAFKFGDASEGVVDEIANDQIEEAIAVQGLKSNLTTRKILNRKQLDALILRKVIVDGEVLLRKRRGFDNACRFAWQVIDADYLDQNLNRVEDGLDQGGVRVAAPGNITKMGVELDAVDKFPVAYWFLHRRPNDYFYNYAELSQQRYIRVPAEEILHIYVQDDDPEQTRGWPWLFAAVVNLFRMDKFEEAALVNATIGASKGVYYKKTLPDGFEGDPSELDDDGYLIDKVQPGMATELPYGVEPVTVDMKYPDESTLGFQHAMMLGAASVFGLSYATASGDLSQANFVSSRLGQNEEREYFMTVQQFLKDNWKIPGFDEELYRAMLARRVTLPISKFEKFNRPSFTGRRWPFVQPVDDMAAKIMALDNVLTSQSDILAETTGEKFEDMCKKIDRDNKIAEKYGIKRIHGTFEFVQDKPVEDAGSKVKPKKAAKE